MRKDRYRSYSELSANEREGTDYRVLVRPAYGSRVAVMAPHGGKIEFLTSEIADAVAASEHNFYAFEGCKNNGNRVLHITSHRFDEPRALTLVAPCERVMTVHGLAGDELSLQIGGRDAALGALVQQKLLGAGFQSKIIAHGAYGGMEPENICNRGCSHAGVQLEIHAGLRQALRDVQMSFISLWLRLERRSSRVEGAILLTRSVPIGSGCWGLWRRRDSSLFRGSEIRQKPSRAARFGICNFQRRSIVGVFGMRSRSTEVICLIECLRANIFVGSPYLRIYSFKADIPLSAYSWIAMRLIVAVRAAATVTSRTFDCKPVSRVGELRADVMGHLLDREVPSLAASVVFGIKSGRGLMPAAKPH